VVRIHLTDLSVKLTIPSLPGALPITDLSEADSYLVLGTGKSVVLYDLDKKQAVELPQDKVILFPTSLSIPTGKTNSENCS